MFTTLPESRAARQRRTGGTLASALVHGAAIAALVAMSMPGHIDARSGPEKTPPITYVPINHPPRQMLEPPMRSSAAHQAPSLVTRFIMPPMHMPVGLPPIDPIGMPITDDNVRIGPGLPTTNLIGPPLGGDPNGIMDDARVDKSPHLLPGAPDPRYPNSLRSSGITGQVIMRFVVDTLGRAELPSVTTVEATHVLFAESVREALGRFRFTPGEVAGRKVRTLVQVPFSFAIR